MSLWAEVQTQASGTTIKQEDLPEKIREITKIILEHVKEYNALVLGIDHLEQNCNVYNGLYEPWFIKNPRPMYPEDTVNAVLATQDYQKMLKFASNLGVEIWKLKSEKGNLERELDDLRKTEEKRWHARLEEKDNRRVAIEMLICLILSIVVAVVVGIGCVHNGDSWLAGLFSGVITLFGSLVIVGEIEDEIECVFGEKYKSRPLASQRMRTDLSL